MGGIILISFLCLALMALVWYSRRNDKVFKFRTKMIDITFKISMENINNGNYNDYHYLYNNLGSYEKMMFSFKPLKPEYWLSEEDYLKIKEYL
jgi:hypothetical protein